MSVRKKMSVLRSAATYAEISTTVRSGRNAALKTLSSWIIFVSCRHLAPARKATRITVHAVSRKWPCRWLSVRLLNPFIAANGTVLSSTWGLRCAPGTSTAIRSHAIFSSQQALALLAHHKFLSLQYAFISCYNLSELYAILWQKDRIYQPKWFFTNTF